MSNTNSNTDKVRERIANYFDSISLAQGTAMSYEQLIDDILSDPDILIRAENQDLPNPGFNLFNTESYKIDVKKSGWVKVESKEAK